MLTRLKVTGFKNLTIDTDGAFDNLQPDLPAGRDVEGDVFVRTQQGRIEIDAHRHRHQDAVAGTDAARRKAG